MIIERLMVAVCTGLIAVQCIADDLLVSAVEVLGYGIVKTQSGRNRIGFSNESIAVDAIDGFRFLAHTSDIPATLGTEFGLQYRVNSTPKGALFEVNSVVLFPEGGLVDRKGKVYKQATETFKIPIGEPSFYGFGFDEPWEIVPGKWVIQIWHNNSRLLQRTFNVVPPEGTP